MTDREPLLTIHPQETVEGALRNALQAADAEARLTPDRDAQLTLTAIARLLRHALAGLSEPNAAAIHAARTLLEFARAHKPVAPTEAHEQEMLKREARDCAAAILKAQLSGGPAIVEPQ